MTSGEGGLRFFRDAGYRADGLELFFDLVFVLCVANMTRILRDDVSWTSALVFVALFVPVWWAWIGVTFYLDRFPADDNPTRALILVAAAGAGLMALAVPAATDLQQLEFAFGYALVRAMLAWLYLRARRVSPDGGTFARRYATGFGIVAALWLASMLVPGPARVIVWVVAMVIDISVPSIAGRRGRLLPVDREHLPGRMGSFVIIVIGESMITTASLTDGRALNPSMGLVLAEGFVLAAALWWGFYDRGAWRRRYEALAGDASGRLAMVVCAYLHFPLVIGISAAAAGVQAALLHPTAAIPESAAIVLAAGCALYLLSMNVMAAVLGIGRRESLTVPRIALVAALAVVAVLGVTQRWTAPAYLAAIAIILLCHIALNLVRARATPVGGPSTIADR
ncbi:low temperature requirement protein A [Glaciibacter flavus]|uniref:low temperature requirement protein A n=1 Tax=Orlajensenia flava TaxID=2565934 RepID=UPI001454F167|nr:low temperature requirement protein A [Glaciibacter flavus]